MLCLLFRIPIAGVSIGFPKGENFTVTEGNEGAIMVCCEILDGVLERDVSVFASTSDITATGNADKSWVHTCSYILEFQGIKKHHVISFL